VENQKDNSMSKELQEKADRMMRELRDALVPIRDEIRVMKKLSGDIK
jgi:hypothetical protein